MILLEVNEYQDFDGLQLSYDDNGNLLEDDQFLFTYDAMNRITQVNRKSDNALVATYKYDFMNRRISKEFTRTESGGNGGGNNGGGNGVGEYSTDADTVALYHYNETSGSVIDSSGNNNHGKAPRSTKRGVEGLFDTTAIKFKGAPILVRKSDSLNSIEDTLTLETFVYLDAKKWKFSRGGSLIHRLGAYQLEIERKTRKASFSIVTKEIADENRRYKKHKHNHKHKHHNHNKPKKQFATIYSNESIPLNQWVHIAAVYDGEKITIYINCTKQTQEKEIDGDIHDCQTPLFLGGIGFFGTMEETRISKTTRSEFNCNPTDDGNNDNPGDDNSETTNIQIKRKFFYNGWRVIEEHEQQAETGQEFSNEVVSRQYVDGLGIDEHLQMVTFDATGANIESEIYFHENARGDTIALTNANGGTVLQLEYTTYGEVFAIDENGQILELDDLSLVVYTFQGRRSDEETGLMYFRNRYYNQELGRWLQRDPLGYVDSYGLYEAFGGNPYGYRDALGLDNNTQTATFVKEDDIIEKEIEDGAWIDMGSYLTMTVVKIPKISTYGFRAQYQFHVIGNKDTAIAQTIKYSYRLRFSDGTEEQKSGMYTEIWLTGTNSYSTPLSFYNSNAYLNRETNEINDNVSYDIHANIDDRETTIIEDTRSMIVYEIEDKNMIKEIRQLMDMAKYGEYNRKNKIGFCYTFNFLFPKVKSETMNDDHIFEYYNDYYNVKTHEPTKPKNVFRYSTNFLKTPFDINFSMKFYHQNYKYYWEK